MSTKKESYNWIIGIIVFVCILLISSTVIRADYNQIYPFYNPSGIFWYTVLSPMVPNSNTLRSSGSELPFWNEYYGLKPWPSLPLIDEIKGFAPPVGLLTNPAIQIPLQLTPFASMAPAFMIASETLDRNNTNNMEGYYIIAEGLESSEGSTSMQLDTDQLSSGLSDKTDDQVDNSTTNSRFRSSMLRMVFIEAESIGKVKELACMGLDIAAIRKGPVVESGEGISEQTYRVEAVISALDEKKLAAEGINWSDVQGKGPVKKIGEPYNVYHSFDEPIHGIKAQLQMINAQYPKIAQLKTIGLSIQHQAHIGFAIDQREK